MAAYTIRHPLTMGGRPISIQGEEYVRELKLVNAKLNFLVRSRRRLIELNGFETLRNQKKLCLVLDLDHTLLHTKEFHKLSPKEQIRWKNSNDFCTWNSKAKGVKYLTKLRPFVRQFLQEASKLFEMYVYTHGTSDYARIMVGFLDPHGVYFGGGSRVISREDSPKKGRKDLVVVPVHKSAVLILDDTKEVWARDQSNLVLIKPYNYFAPKDPNGGTRSLSEEGMDESEIAGPLSRALLLLRQVHKSFFECHNIFEEELLRILLDNNGIHREKLQGIKDGYSLCDLGSQKRKSVNHGCPSAKRQRC